MGYAYIMEVAPEGVDNSNNFSDKKVRWQKKDPPFPRIPMFFFKLPSIIVEALVHKNLKNNKTWCAKYIGAKRAGSTWPK